MDEDAFMNDLVSKMDDHELNVFAETMAVVYETEGRAERNAEPKKDERKKNLL